MRTTTRRIVPALAVGALVLTACGSSDDDASSDEPADTTEPATDDPTSTAPGTDDPAAGDPTGADASCSNTLEDGVLTLATGEPAFEPWVIGDAPESGEGFEAAVAMAVAREMGYEGDAVTWVRAGFDEAIQPGPKNFDMNLQQFSITPERDETVDFSLPYYSGNQALVALDGSAAVGASIADLKGLQLGAQSGTTSLAFITDVIQPDSEPLVYDDNSAVKAALEANQLDAAVFDLPTALFVSAVEIEGSSVIGQFSRDAGGQGDELGFVLENDSPLKPCVDAAITALTDSGELDEITDQWLEVGDVAPIIPAE
ncbi:MAG: ABC transporter substrate-binding protein [Ilumatobacter sp.]|uniref:ABC transporter substrate-binding protein n=1 Tax=Ilumatobacter sp. TaxID=1967498 RepID=UPI003297D34D